MIRSRVKTVRKGKQRTRPSFSIDFFSNPTVKAARGDSPSVNTRATIATVTDWEGVTREVLSGENRFGGMRRVHNRLVTTSADFSNAVWAKDTGGTGVAPVVTQNYGTVAAPDGTFTAARLQLDRSAGGTFSRVQQAGLANPFTGTRVRSIWCRTTSGDTQQFTFRAGAAATNIQPLLTATGVWQRFSVQSDFTAASVSFEILSFTTTGGTQALDILVWHPMEEDVTGQSNQNPSEYVSVGVLSSPFQGANVDGVQYYATQNGNTVASNVVTEATGALISSAIRGGFLPEPAATDLLTARADARDMTTANWTLGATMTRARTSVGADGVANKATRLTGGAVAATNIITTTITAAASSRTYSVLIKRVTGTGPVRITQDNFATSTDISSLINSSTYTLVQINQSQLNAQLGIKVDTNLDAIDADWNGFSAGDLTGVKNSQIPDTITTRNLDLLVYALTGWYNAIGGSFFAQFIMPAIPIGSTAVVWSINDATANNYIACYITNAAGTHVTNFEVKVGGVQQTLRTINSPSVGTTVKTSFVFVAADFIGFQNNVATAAGAAGTIPTVTRLEVGSQVSTNELGTYIQKEAYYPSRLPNAVAQSLTA